MDILQWVSDGVRRLLESLSGRFQTSSNRVQFLIRPRLAFRSNTFGHSTAFGFSFERVWSFEHFWLFFNVFGYLLNAFGFSFERVSYNARMRPYAERTRLDKKRAIPCVWRVLLGPEAQVWPVRPWPYQFLAIALSVLGQGRTSFLAFVLSVLNQFSVEGLRLSIHEFTRDN